MGFKPLTKQGEQFIRDACNANTNNFSGSLPYALGRSNAQPNTVFTAQSYFQGKLITDNATLANALIFWFNQYCGDTNYSLDANIIAAQTFVESGYQLWEYSNGGNPNKSSAMGISQLYDNEIWNLFFNGDGESVTNPKDQTIFDAQQAAISTNLTGDLTDIRNIVPFSTNSTTATNLTAIDNRIQLFQNIMNNTEIMIQTQCKYMSQLGVANNNLASSTLFAYAVSGDITSKTYNDAINKAVSLNLPIRDGSNYVQKIFKVLGGLYKKTLNGFGKDYVYDSTPNDQANKNLSSSVILNQGSNTPPIGNQGTFPPDTVKAIVDALNKIGITNQYVQSGILAVITTEGSFTPRSELSYSNTPVQNLRLIFGIKVSDLNDSDLSALSKSDVNFYAHVYEGRWGSPYGNTTFGDGFKYRGRGFNQITFKDAYQDVKDYTGIDVVNNPDLLNNIPTAAAGVAIFFKNKFDAAFKINLFSKRYGINTLSQVENLTLGTQIAFQANAGWGSDLSQSIYPREFARQMSVVGTLARIVNPNILVV